MPRPSSPGPRGRRGDGCADRSPRAQRWSRPRPSTGPSARPPLRPRGPLLGGPLPLAARRHALEAAGGLWSCAVLTAEGRLVMQGAVFEEYARPRERWSEALKEGLAGLVPPDARGGGTSAARRERANQRRSTPPSGRARECGCYDNGGYGYYVKPWNRAQPYLIGIVLGYILHK